MKRNVIKSPVLLIEEIQELNSRITESTNRLYDILVNDLQLTKDDIINNNLKENNTMVSNIITDNVLSVLKECIVENNIVKLPERQLDRKLYMDVAKQISLINGKWDRKVKGFIFKDGCIKYFNDLINGDKKDIKKEYQIFETPENIADKLVSMINKFNFDTKILEPSAGKGALIKALLNKFHVLKDVQTNFKIDCYELYDVNRKYLTDNFRDRVCILGNDFLQSNTKDYYDIIIMNPPFNKYQYIDHIMHAFNMLKSHGQLLAIVPVSYKYNTRKKEVLFKEFVEKYIINEIELDSGDFKESGTNIKTAIIELTRLSVRDIKL